jgi:hypothetical protein
MTMNQKMNENMDEKKMDEAVMMCPNCHEMKMGPMSMKEMMMKCDGCGGAMKEMKMM